MSSIDSLPNELSHLFRGGLVACLPLERPIDELLEVGDSLLAAPVPTVALGAGTGATVAALMEFRARYGKNLCVGAWRVRTPAECRQVIEAGAQFVLVQDNPRIHAECASHGVPCVPLTHIAASGGAVSMQPMPILLWGAVTVDDLRMAHALHRERAALGLATALAIGSLLLDIHLPPAALIRHVRQMRRLWEKGGDG